MDTSQVTAGEAIVFASTCPQLETLRIEGLVPGDNDLLSEDLGLVLGNSNLKRLIVRRISEGPSNSWYWLQKEDNECSARLEELILSDCELDPSIGDYLVMKLVALGIHRSLKHLDISNSYSLSNKGCTEISNYFGVLETLVMSELPEKASITNAGLRNLTHSHRSLQEFNFRGALKISEPGLSTLLNCFRLHTLRLTECESLQYVELSEELLALEVLELSETYVTDEVVCGILEKSSNLRELDVSGCANLTDAVLQSACASCRNIKTVRLAYCNITNQGLRYLVLHRTKLQELVIGRARMETRFANDTGLPGSAITRHSLDLLASPASFKALVLRSAELDRGAHELGGALDYIAHNFVSLQLLDLGASKGLNLPSKSWRPLIHLRSICFSFCNDLNSEALVALLEKAPNLEALFLDQCHPLLTLDVQLYRRISELSRKLELLDVSSPKSHGDPPQDIPIRVQEFAELAASGGFSSLKVMDARGNRVGQALYEALRKEHPSLSGFEERTTEWKRQWRRLPLFD